MSNYLTIVPNSLRTKNATHTHKKGLVDGGRGSLFPGSEAFVLPKTRRVMVGGEGLIPLVIILMLFLTHKKQLPNLSQD